MPGFPAFDGGTHYGDANIVEDVTQLVFDISPDDTPFIQITGEGKRGIAPVAEWRERSITTRALNRNPEGFTYTFTAGINTPTAVTNVQQIFVKEIRVSNSEGSYGHHAIADMYADQMEIGLREIATDYEHAQIVGTLVSGNATDVSRSMIGIIQALVTNGTTHNDASGTASLSETIFNNRLQISWDNGGAPADCLVGGAGKRNFSSFTGGTTKFMPADEHRIINTISVYESDFFTLMIRLSRDVPAGSSEFDALLLDRTMLKRRTARPFTSKRTADIADSTDGVIVGESTLEWGVANAHAYLQSNEYAS